MWTAIRSGVFREDIHSHHCRRDRRGGVLLFHVLVGGVVAGQDLTAVAAKPIAATMTKTASSSGYELGLLAAAGTLTIIPGAIVIYFVRNYIAKGFALGRV